MLINGSRSSSLSDADDEYDDDNEYTEDDADNFCVFFLTNKKITPCVIKSGL